MKRPLAFFAVPAVILALGACDLTGVGGEPGRVALDLEIANPSGELDVDRVRVRITAPDFDADRWYELDIEGNTASGSLDCEPGTDRFVEVDVYEDGAIAYTAAGTVDLEPGETKTLSLTADSVYSDYLRITGRVGSFGTRDHQLDSPSDVAVAQGYLYVVDPAACKLKACDPTDLEKPPVWVRDLSFLDEETDSPYFPATVAYFPELGGLLVADPVNGRLDAFDPDDGTHLGEFTAPDGLVIPADMLHWPTAASVFVVDTDDSELYLLDSDGDAWSGGRVLYDDGASRIENPVGVALISSAGETAHLAVTSAPEDEGTPGRIYFYTYLLGEGPECTGSAGGEHLERPAGIACAEGLLFVADATLHALKIFDTEGGFLDSFGFFGDRLGTFTNPLGVFAGDLRLYVADSLNHRVQHFDVLER
ncbi:MAG: hypothetical protein A2Y64_03200 [Candidatus Coatesbacteria bacterium RBG_13_66_14]|uniref:BPP domain-containing protein n=1 Tax=Candidatus Coatesbacteria bacterium RBG_13_66_14 TaxID=1817816 RepID=A0A1F5EZG5_9BACT|nr:MAG: hypothetical protein A2Y64_03200 [Candidatus Coatesbacteria bacterium RBG_13_66_14]